MEILKPENIFVVGGAVRDKLLGFKPKDIDYVVVGSSPEEMKSLGFEQVGADFPVFLHPITRDEWALARTERKNGNGYSGFTVNHSSDVTLESDLSRRDLTINSMAEDSLGNIIDPFNGKQDLENKVLRHTTEAFSDDPLRVLRIARFMARFGDEWKIHPETKDLMRKIHSSGELNHLTPERVWKETEKALSEPRPDLYFKILNGTGLFPEIEAMVGVEQNPIHHPEGDVFVHTMLALKRAAELDFDVETRFAVLCHDFGKPVSKAIRGNMYFHEDDGLPVINSFCKRLMIPNRFRDIALMTCEHHTRCHRFLELTSRKVFKLLVTRTASHKNPERFHKFLNACICDAQGRGPTRVNEPYPQADAAREVLKTILSVNTKLVVQLAIQKGKTGEKIGMAVNEAYLSAIVESLSKSEKDNDLESSLSSGM